MIRFLVFFVFSILITHANAQVSLPDNDKPLPVLEGGAGVFHARFPHYPSAKTQFSLTLPYPTFIYRGDILRADENGGLRSRFFKSDHFEINLSLGGALPVSSEKIVVRDGMPDLKTMIEIGPGLIWHITPKNKKYRFRLSLNLPIRMAYAIDFDETDDRGIVFNPFLFGFGKLASNFQTFYFLSYRWATREFQQTFFEVEEKYQTDERATFFAKKGNVLASAGLGFSYMHKKKFQPFLGMSYTNYSINPNRNSPLYQKNYAYTVAFGMTWWFYKSEKTVAPNN